MATEVEKEIEFQAAACDVVGSPLYGRVLRGVLDDVRDGGVCRDLLAPHEHEPRGNALGLRFLGAVHRLVLTGDAPRLAAQYPSAGGTPDADLWPAFLDTVAGHAEQIAAGLQRGVQTNEVGRAAALVGGFAAVAAETGLSLRELEIGASAGLLLRWDHFRITTPDESRGPAGSPVVLDGPWRVPPPLGPGVVVAERRGCDPAPIDPRSEDGRLQLRAFLWPDQVERRARLDGALAIAADVPAAVDRASADAWLAEQLAAPTPGLATVVHHSIVMQYLTEQQRTGTRQALEEAGDRASADAPLAWLRMEPGGPVAEVTLTTWPGGDERVIATSGYHGQDVAWRTEAQNRGTTLDATR